MLQEMLAQGSGGSSYKVEMGTMNFNESTQVKIPIDFTPKILLIMSSSTGNKYFMVYNEDVSTTEFMTGTGNAYGVWYTIGSGSNIVLDSISPEVKVHWSNSLLFYWVAIG